MPPERRHREDLQRMAEDTLNIIERDIYNVKNTTYKLHTGQLERSTEAYPPQAYDNWKSPPSYQFAHNHGGPYINIAEVSTLACARYLFRTLRNNSRGSSKIGVLNFASATKPGGGFKNGAEAQEESIARVSNLYQSLCTCVARQFYDVHSPEDPLYTHSMIYSPDVEVIKDDKGTPTRPMQIDVLTCAAVNAHRLRQSEFAQWHGRHATEKKIEAVMKERMGRILCSFEGKGVRNLVLGSFGIGVFRNDVSVVARLWAELLSVPGARFSGSFDRVFFAILGRKTFVDFGNAFNNSGQTTSHPNPPGSVAIESPPVQYASDCCLLCHSKPAIGNHDFCGETSRRNASSPPLLMEVPPNHVTFEMVQTKFSSAWNCPMRRPCPPLKKVFKIVESPATRAQYEQYKSEHGNEVFRYHGTSRECRLGETDNHYPCSSNTCPACSIVRTSFRVSLANPGCVFGRAIYTSSASNKSSSYSPEGVMFLAKVVLGKQYVASNFLEVESLPPGYNSVVWDRLNGRLNETAVYEDAAIRPVFLIVFPSPNVY